ncbi:MAG: hypothetical protein KIT14_24250 [bacterium]|nr:hypothetical protein [bacterium]
MGDAAPGGGVFAGPSFVGTPSAAGDGWIAFRALVAEGNTTEQIVATNLRTRERRVVANLGQTVNGQVGRLKQFLGRPTVNARGEVAFAAIVTPPDGVKQDPLAPTPGGIFLSTGGPSWHLDVVAAPGLDTGLGILDLTTTVNVLAEGGSDSPERTPALNDAGDVAFVASTLDRTTSGAAIFVRRAGGPLTHLVKLGDPFGDGKFSILGPPALNNTGALAFRGLADGNGLLDGIFKVQAGATTLLAANGIVPQRPSAPFPNDQQLFEFGDTVTLNDAGDVLFTAGPLFDFSDDASQNDEGGAGVVVWRGGATYLVGFPGQPIAGRGRITSIQLGPDGGSRLAPPAFAADGQIIFFASLNGGSSEMIIRTGLLDQAPGAVVNLGGPTADTTPVGGTYLTAASAPVVDALGTVVFFARIAGSPVSQAVIALPPDRPGEAINIGDPAAGGSDGFFGGPPFFAPVLNDADDVVFKSFVARGPALGIFRWRAGQLEALVRVGDIAPIKDGRAITNLVGDPSLNASGDIAFAATAVGVARGIYTAGSGGLRAVALPGQPLEPPDPSRKDAYYRTLAPNPAIGDTGAVVFRGTIEYDDPFDPIFSSIKEEVVLLADASGVRILAARGQDSGVGEKFFKFRDPSTRGGPVVFRAPLGDMVEKSTGLFLADPSGIAPLAVKGADIGGMTITDLTGRAQIDAAGNVVFGGKLRRPGSTEVAALVRRTPAGFTSIVETRQTGPMGGRFRSLGRPTAASNGNIAFRGNFEPFTGGTAGFFLSTPAGLSQLVRVGEGAATTVGGRITTLNQSGSLNARDHLAFLAGIGGGRTRSAIFLAAPTTTAVSNLRVRRKLPSNDLDFVPKDRIVVNATLAPATNLPGLTSAPTQGGKSRRRRERLRPQAVSIAVGDLRGTLWSVNLPASSIDARGRALVAKAGVEQPIAGLRVRIAKNGTIRVKARSTPLDFAFSSSVSRPFDEVGMPKLFPPFNVRVDVGADGGSAPVPCNPKKLSFRCGR